MKVEYTYRYANGDEVTITVNESEFELLRELDRESHNEQRRETRRHTSLDVLDEGRVPHAAGGDDPAAIFEAAEALRTLDRAVGTLSCEQRELIHKIFVEDVAASRIAQDEGVSKSAISHRLDRLLKKLRELLE